MHLGLGLGLFSVTARKDRGSLLQCRARSSCGASTEREGDDGRWEKGMAKSREELTCWACNYSTKPRRGFCTVRCEPGAHAKGHRQSPETKGPRHSGHNRRRRLECSLLQQISLISSSSSWPSSRGYLPQTKPHSRIELDLPNHLPQLTAFTSLAGCKRKRVFPPSIIHSMRYAVCLMPDACPSASHKASFCLLPSMPGFCGRLRP